LIAATIGPGVDDLSHGADKISLVSRYEAKPDASRGCRNQSIHRLHQPSRRLALRQHIPADKRDFVVNWDNAIGKPDRQIDAQPSIELIAPATGRQTIYSVSKFRQRDDAEKHPIFINLGEPRRGARIGPRFKPLRHQVGIEQEAHRSIGRVLPLIRSISSFEPRNGDRAKKSASVPSRLVFRSHSSTETTITA